MQLYKAQLFFSNEYFRLKRFAIDHIYILGSRSKRGGFQISGEDATKITEIVKPSCFSATAFFVRIRVTTTMDPKGAT